MIGYPTIEAQVDHDFDRARRRAYARRVLNRLRRSGEPDRLRSFDEVKASLAGWSQVYRGLQLVEVDKIVGSVGRYREFDSSLLPKWGRSETRWKRIDRSFHRAEYLPPVSLYEVGGLYYVRDGNHRVSVARFHGIREIEAEVVQVRGHRSGRTEQRRSSREWSYGGVAITIPGFRRALQVEQNAGGMRHGPLYGEAMAAIEEAVGRSWDCPGGVRSASVLTRDDVKLVGPLF